MKETNTTHQNWHILVINKRRKPRYNKPESCWNFIAAKMYILAWLGKHVQTLLHELKHGSSEDNYAEREGVTPKSRLHCSKLPLTKS